MSPLEISVIVLYLAAMVALAWKGYRQTQTAADYLVAGRKAHPFVMAMSYGAAFISTSAIIGFGGAAAVYGMGLLWLVFLNIFIGIFLAFIVLGGPVRRMGQALDAHTFAEFLGLRFQSRFIQIFAGLVICLFIPLYAAAVLIGGCEFLVVYFKIDPAHFAWVLIGFSVLVGVYVILGGLKGAMYVESMQGSIMVVGMLVLLAFSYIKADGFLHAHQNLTDLAPLVPEGMQKAGHQGWTSFPQFGWGQTIYDNWWVLVSTIILGVGIGALAQPQLVVRLMTVRSKRELNRAVVLGAIFMFAIPGSSYIAGSLSNVYFARHGQPMTGRVVSTIDAERGHVMLQLAQQNAAGQWEDQPGRAVPAMLAADAPPAPAGLVHARSISIIYAKGNLDQIIPTYITSALPKWFGAVFLLILLSAAMSTASSQFHTIGASLSRDVYQTVTQRKLEARRAMNLSRIAMLAGVAVAVAIALYARGGGFIYRATAIFFGLCAATFLPSLIGGLFSRRMTRIGAIASMAVGFGASLFWLVFVKAREAGAVGLVQKLTGGKTSILEGYPNWPVVDPILIALPLAALTAILVSALTRKPDENHLELCFGNPREAEEAPAAAAMAGKQ